MLRPSPGHADARSPRSRAFTLLEVVVGMFLLGVLAATVSVALSRIERNANRIDRQREAIQLLDVLLVKWTESPSGVPVPTAGSIIGQRSMAFQTRVIGQRSICGNPVKVIRIEVVAPDKNEPVPLASVDVVQDIATQQRNAQTSPVR